jgi:hypothetical protein
MQDTRERQTSGTHLNGSSGIVVGAGNVPIPYSQSLFNVFDGGDDDDEKRARLFQSP